MKHKVTMLLSHFKILSLCSQAGGPGARGHGDRATQGQADPLDGRGRIARGTVGARQRVITD